MDKTVELLRRHEGVKPHAYKCSAGYVTIGVGRNIDENGGLGLSDDEIDYLLQNDIKRCQQELTTYFVWFEKLDEVRKNAMINLVFNLGLSRLRKFEKALFAMSEQDWETASKELLDSRWAEQVGQRAVEIAEMVRTGEYI
tara:strand:+ start:1707 stop:2129 length:423 start_codon:yes stop_codon:yes gene_type:complete